MSESRKKSKKKMASAKVPTVKAVSKALTSTRSKSKPSVSIEKVEKILADNLPVLANDPARVETLQSYLSHLRQYPLLSPEKELEVSKRYYETHDPEAAQLLALSNLRLVVKIAYEYIRSGFQVLDLIQEGNIGLLQAVREYNPYRGVKFSSYASYWIKAYIRSFILKNWSLVKLGTTRAQRTLFYRLQKEKQRLEAMGLPAAPKYLAENLQVKEDEVIEMSQRMSGRDMSLNAPLRHDDSDGDALLNTLRDSAEGADSQLADREIAEEFTERLNAFERTLTGKELLIFRERLRSEDAKTLQEIGDLHGITRERVRQIEARVLEKLRAYMKANARFRDAVIDIPKK